MDISINIHGKFVDMDMDMDGKFYINGKPGYRSMPDVAVAPRPDYATYIPNK